MNRSDLVSIRAALPDDKAFIFSTFLRGLYYGNSYCNLIQKDLFMDNYHKVIEALLASPNIAVKVACLKDDPEVILGYSISKDTRLDWVFVKKAWRGIGIAKSLTPSQVSAVTHITTVGQSILRKHPQTVFNPFALSS